jgi:Leucine-rich repeat (LRR) protein
MSYLKFLALNSNEIESVSLESFRELQYLDISSNKLAKVARNAFQGLSNLRDNLIDRVEPRAFFSLANLLHLVLGVNQLKLNETESIFFGLGNSFKKLTPERE